MNSALGEKPIQNRLQLAVAALALLAVWFVLCRHLSGEWSVNEQYSYGWFVPFFAAFLFWLRWDDRPQVDPGSRRSEVRSRKGIAIGIAILALLILLPVRLFEVANPDWRPLGWIHTAAVVVLTLVLIWWMGGWPWLRHFAFPILFVFVAVPWISPIEIPIVQGLMRVVAQVASELSGVIGIPAQVEGNLIRVSTGVVGVNEACSGVRSLQTSLMIGLLFGELKRFSVARRFLLVLGAIALALLANFGRALFLVWVAETRGVAAVGGWHDFAGYAIVGIVFLGALGLAAALGKGRRKKEEFRNAAINDLTSPRSPFNPFSPLPSSFLLSWLLWSAPVEIGVEAWYRSHETYLASQPGWTIRPPENASGFRDLKIDELVRQTLRFDNGREVIWKSFDPVAPENSTTNYLFFFRWNPGSASVVRARAHRPDICLPSVGWEQLADRGMKTYQTSHGIALPIRHVSFRQLGGTAVVHTFFCLQEDKIRTDEARPDLQLAAGIQPDWSIGARSRAVRLGVRNQGQQVLEVLFMNNRPASDEAMEARFEAMLGDIVVPTTK